MRQTPIEKANQVCYNSVRRLNKIEKQIKTLYLLAGWNMEAMTEVIDCIKKAKEGIEGWRIVEIEKKYELTKVK